MDKPFGPLVMVIGSEAENMCRRAGMRHVHDATHVLTYLDRDGATRPEIEYFGSYVILIPEGGEDVRDAIAINLGDERCRWAYFPATIEEIRGSVDGAKPLWTDELSRMRDVAEPLEGEQFKCGIADLDRHGFRIVLPAFMPIIGPYASGKSVLLRQLLMNLWRMHGWRFLLTSFEEKIKPRYQRDLRRYLIRKPMTGAQGELLWTADEIAKADAEIDECAVFLRRKRNTILDIDRLLSRIEFAVRVYGIRVIAIDPINEIDHQVPKGESKTDYMGKFIMRLKALADDYNLLMICCAHPPKDGVEKRLSKNGVLTLNDAADTAHYGNKADIGWCVWRDIDGPTLLHCDKLKDHETMGKPFLAELELNPIMNAFNVKRMGFHILQDQESRG